MTSPSGRATQAREALRDYVYECGLSTDKEADGEAARLIPEGSIILTAEEARLVSSAVRGYPPGEIREQALALLAGGRNPE